MFMYRIVYMYCTYSEVNKVTHLSLLLQATCIAHLEWKTLDAVHSKLFVENFALQPEVVSQQLLQLVGEGRCRISGWM